MENSNQNITCVCVCARAHECVCVCVCVSYLGSEEEDGKDEGLWGVNSEMAYSPLFLSVEQSWFFFFSGYQLPREDGPQPSFHPDILSAA